MPDSRCWSVVGTFLIAACGQSSSPDFRPVFVDRAVDAGLSFRHQAGNRGDYYMPEVMSGGVALLDFDVDGDLDVFLVQGGYLGEAELDSPPPTLFENQLTDGLLMFKDVSGSSGLRHDSYGMGAAIGDIDGDLDPDIYVTAYGSNSLFRNDGGGRFTKLAVAGDDRWSSSAAFFDYDRDGRLDLLVVNYVSFDVNFNKTCFSAARDYCSPLTYKPVPDALYQNADGTFVDVSNRAGLDAVYGSGLGVVIVDINNDQWLDVYVANDGLANQLWINEQGQLSDQGLSLGAAYNGEGMPEAGMGVTADDIDGDGDDDLFVTHLRNETNTLYENLGASGFTDITERRRMASSSRRNTGFGTGFLDYDNDGLLDIFIANGAVQRVADQQGEFPYREANQLLHNNGSSFDDVSAAGGPDIVSENVSRGAAFGDLDNDGDTDIVVVNANGSAQLLINEVGQDNNWIGLDLRSAGAIGMHARVAVLSEQAAVWRTARRDGSYLSSSDPRVLFGLGKSASPRDVLVHWRNDQKEVWPGLTTGQYHQLQPGSGEKLETFCKNKPGNPVC